MSFIKVSAQDFAIKSATIYKSCKAEIVRSFPIELKAGLNTIEITGISSTIDPLSVRVTGLGDARLFDVVCKLGTNKATIYAPDGPSESMRLLRSKKATLEAMKRNSEIQCEILTNYGKSLTGEFVPPTQMAQFLQSFVEQGGKSIDAMAALSEEIVEIDRAIEAEAEKASLKKGTCTGEITAVVRSAESSSINLLLTYMVNEAQWFPIYELHAKTENGRPSPQVHLHYRARIIQQTGEDWTDAQLTLNTSESDSLSQRIPFLHQVKLRARSGGNNNMKSLPNNSNTGVNVNIFSQARFGAQHHHQQQQQHRTSVFGAPQTASGLFGSAPAQTTGSSVFGSSAPLFGGAPSTTSTPFGAALLPTSIHEPEDEAFEEVLAPLVEPSTTVAETPLAMIFSVDGKATIPSDGVEHQVAVAVIPFDSAISYVTVPRADPRLFLRCQVKNTSEYRLLPGPVRVIMDDSFVSHTRINDVITGDTFDCTLGHDATAKVTYIRHTRVKKTIGGAFSESFKTTTYTTTVGVHNKHTFPVEDLTVRDSIPMSDDEQIKVVLRKPEGLASAREGDEVEVGSDGLKVMWEKVVDGKGGEKEGKFEWKSRVEAGSKLILEAQWEVKSPADTILDFIDIK